MGASRQCGQGGLGRQGASGGVGIGNTAGGSACRSGRGSSGCRGTGGSCLTAFAPRRGSALLCHSLPSVVRRPLSSTDLRSSRLPGPGILCLGGLLSRLGTLVHGNDLVAGDGVLSSRSLGSIPGRRCRAGGAAGRRSGRPTGQTGSRHGSGNAAFAFTAGPIGRGGRGRGLGTCFGRGCSLRRGSCLGGRAIRRLGSNSLGTRAGIGLGSAGRGSGVRTGSIGRAGSGLRGCAPLGRGGHRLAGGRITLAGPARALAPLGRQLRRLAGLGAQHLAPGIAALRKVGVHGHDAQQVRHRQPALELAGEAGQAHFQGLAHGVSPVDGLQPAIGGQIPHTVGERGQRHDQLGGLRFGRRERHIAGVDDAQALVVTDLHEQVRIAREGILAVGIDRVRNLAQRPGGTQIQVELLAVMHGAQLAGPGGIEIGQQLIGQGQFHHAVHHTLGRRTADVAAGRGDRGIAAVVGPWARR